jgi:GH24 family phage-related lysozyme (muramidase)
MSNPAPITLRQLFQYYRGLPHQMAALEMLEEDLRENGYEVAMRRDRPWFSVWSLAGKQPETPTTSTPAAVAVALPLVKEFEGCKLTAYPDPETGGDPWTIGWGSTTYSNGAPVRRGDQISQDLADALLAVRLERDGHLLAQRVSGWATLSPNQQAALLSFTYNCGPSWFGAQGFETLSKALKAGDLDAVPAALMLYVNPGGPSEAGLRRRRKAEGALWSAAPGQSNPKPLPVPWFSQRDSRTDQALRMCFSSSCAMLLEFLKPGTLQGPNGDDQYLARVRQFGDTTDANAQIRALASYGITARFSNQVSFSTLEQQIAAGIPVPCGYLHRGPVSRPAGGGHWLIVVGITSTHVIVHDPFGEADLVNGTTLDRPARFASYSRANWGRRWEVEGPGTGWAIIATR